MEQRPIIPPNWGTTPIRELLAMGYSETDIQNAAKMEQATAPNRHNPASTAPQSEARIQAECVEWFRRNYPGFIIYHIDNGAQKNAVRASQARAIGILTGIPDLHIPVARRGYNSLYIEMKRPGHKATFAQRERMNQLGMYGNLCVVCDSVESFTTAVTSYMSDAS